MSRSTKNKFKQGDRVATRANAIEPSMTGTVTGVVLSEGHYVAIVTLDPVTLTYRDGSTKDVGPQHINRWVEALDAVAS